MKYTRGDLLRPEVFLPLIFAIVRKSICFAVSLFARIYEKREEIIFLIFFSAIVGIGLVLFSLEARGQSKFYSFPNRGGADGAKGNAMLHTLLQENVERRSETTANSASITALQAAADSSITQLRSATEASLTAIGDCGAQGMLFGRGHAAAGANDCIPSLQVANDGRVSLQGGMKFGDYGLCDPTTAGTMRYNAGAKRMEFCNGSIWGMLGGNMGCSINFPAVTNADLDTFYDTTDAIYSGETATASVAGATPATVRRNGANTGMSSGVTINQGNSVGIRGRSASLFNQTANFTLDIGAYTACWQITTKQQDVLPDAFVFNALNDQQLNVLVTSNSVTVNGFDGPLTVSVSGQGSPQLKVGSGSWVSSGEINPGQSLILRLTTSTEFETEYVVTATLGAYSTAWSVKTRANCTPGSQTYGSSGTYSLPIQAGCSTVTVKLWGAGGGGGTNTPSGGGQGGFVSGTLTSVGGKTLQIKVGGGGATGAGGFNGGGGGGSGIDRTGGGGGGATTIQIDGNYVMAASGGGGAGGWNGGGYSASTDITLPNLFNLNGGNGANGFGSPDNGCNAGGGGGGGGGAGGQPGDCNNGSPGGNPNGLPGKSIVPTGGTVSGLNTSDPHYNGNAGKSRQPGMAYVAWSN